MRCGTPSKWLHMVIWQAEEVFLDSKLASNETTAETIHSVMILIGTTPHRRMTLKVLLKN